MVVAEVWVYSYKTTMPFRILTKDIERTVKKLSEKYDLEDLEIVVPTRFSYIVCRYDDREGKWYAHLEAVHPRTAAKYNILNAYSKSWKVENLNSLLG